MRKVIFNSESVQMKSYLENRFMIDQPLIYIAGNNNKLALDKNSLLCLQMVLKEESKMDYSMCTEENQTVEILEFDGLKIELYSDASPEKLMNNDELKQILKIGVFQKVNEENRIEIEKLFRVNGFNIFMDSISKRSCPYKISKNKNFFVVKCPVVCIPEEMQEDFDRMNKMIHSVVNTENKIKSFA
ncbi:hypothetical protein R3O67_33125 [Bacillus cereus]|uniref:hypothetical protein n=1 Tax=Bacillus cereus TaxID=1396 RepID=UPI00307AD311